MHLVTLEIEHIRRLQSYGVTTKSFSNIEIFRDIFIDVQAYCSKKTVNDAVTQNLLQIFGKKP